MGKHHGFQQKGYVNPLAAARSSGGGGGPVSRHEGVATITIKEYLARPRPTLDEFKERIAEREREQQRLDEWEEQSGAQYRRLLARDRRKKLAAAAGKRARSSSSSSSSGSSDSSGSSGSSSSSSCSSSSSSSSGSEGSAHRHRKHRHRHGRHHKEARAEPGDGAKGPWKLSEFFRAATRAAAAPGSEPPPADSRASRHSPHRHHHRHRHHHHHRRSHSRSREQDAARS